MEQIGSESLRFNWISLKVVWVTESNAFLVPLSHHSSTLHSSRLSPEQFSFISCHGCFSKPFPLRLSLVLSLSPFLPHSHSLLPSLVAAISHFLPPYFILTLPLIRPSILLVHSSLFLPLYSPPYSPPPPFCLSAAYPPVPSFFWASSHTLSLPLPISLFYFHAALSQWAVYRNHINPERRSWGEREIERET